jgi:bacillithiol system protein YtxJ
VARRGTVTKEGPFEPVRSVDELQAWLDRRGPVLLYLHDPWCPVNAASYRELAPFSGPILIVDVAAGRALSHYVEERTGIRHESPQVILFKDGEAVWHASHFRITGYAVADALDRLSEAAEEGRGGASSPGSA